MRRGRRWMVNGLTGVLLILALAVAGIWSWSYFGAIRIIKYDFKAGIERRLLCSRGGVTLISIEISKNLREASHGFHGFHVHIFDWSFEVSPQTRRFLGFNWSKQDSGYGGSDVALTLPHWFLFTLFAALPSIRLYRHIRRNRRPLSGHCPTCDYDLRATPDRCPECGAVPARMWPAAPTDAAMKKEPPPTAPPPIER